MGRRVNRWLVAGLAAVAVLALAWAGVSWLSRPPDAAWQRIQTQRVFVVATDASYPPFSAVDGDGNLFGFEIDLTEEIARRWGVSAAFENITYDALLAAVVSGRDDAVISAFVAQPERTREVAYTRSYFTGGIVAVIRHADGRPLAGDALAWSAGQTLAVEFGAGGDALARQWARRAEGVTVSPLATSQDALLAVQAGQAGAALVDAISAYEFLQHHPDLAITGAPLESEPYVIAVSISSPQLLRELETVLAEMEADGALPALRTRWFGDAAAQDLRQP